jgi:hypothetical protein
MDYEELYRKSIKDLATLQNEFNALHKEHRSLQHEYSENTIIQSMNDMKDKYEQLVQSTVPSYKYHILNEKFVTMETNMLACAVLIDYINNSISKFDNIFVNMGDIDISKLEMQLNIIKDLLQRKRIET